MGDIFQETLRLSLPAIGIAFRDSPPSGVPRAEVGPASCSYWKRAAQGETFWTDVAHHQNCPIGALTHGVPLSEHRRAQLRVAVYAPLAAMPCPPDLVVVRGTTAQLMVLLEAAQAAGVAPDAPAMGRPTCAALPQALDSKRPAMSLGCIGNRVYTGLADGEGYVALPASAIEAVTARLGILARANAELEKFHRARANA